MKTKTLALGLLLSFWPIQGAAAAEPAVLLNEIAWMGTTVSANDEWLELANQTEQEIDLTGWRLEAADGSPKTELTGKIPANGYFLLERTDDQTVLEQTADQIFTGSLSNSGEWLKLSDLSGNLIDEINAAAGWPGGDNDAKKTLERVSPDSWQTGLEPGGTPKIKNSVIENPGTDEDLPPTEDQNPEEKPTPVKIETGQPTANRGDIVFNEVFPDPVGSDSEQEFIELKNAGPVSIDLTSWKITNLAKQTFVLPSLIMMPQSLAVFYRFQTNLALNNLKEKITLYTKEEKIIDQVSYTAAIVDQSYQKNDLNKLSWGKISPFKPNLAKVEILPQPWISGPKLAQVAEIIDFDASDSFDPENRPLKFFWDFGDGRTNQGISVRQIYIKPGNYEVALKAVASEFASSTEILKIKITGIETETPAATTTPTTAAGLGGPVITETALPKPTVAEEDLPYIYISEFLPGPDTKSGQEEFIEIFSQETWPTDLSGFVLDDAEGGSKPFIIPNGTIIKPGQYLAFFKLQTKLALNDGGDSIRLLSPGNRIIDQVDYGKTKKGLAFALAPDFSWQETEVLTPGRPNGLPETEETEPAAAEEAKTENSATTTGKILGAEIVRPPENTKTPAAKPAQTSPSQSGPTGKLRYLVSALFTAVALGIGAVVKLRKAA